MGDALVVGYGNDLRGDDGAGRWVADQMEGRGLAGVEVISCAQLVPELALELVDKRVVVFVDASIEVDELAVAMVEAEQGSGVMTHHGNPAAVLEMAGKVGELPAKAFLVSVPAAEFGLGFEFSQRTKAAAAAAVDVVAGLLASAD